jgi:nucleotide-binding universal stress UspA family protein
MYQRILVPLEREGGPEAHLWHAVQLAKEERAELTLLRIITVIPSDEYFFRRLQVEEGSRAAKNKGEAQAYVSRLAQELKANGVDAKPEVIVSDQAEDEAIVAHAAEMGDDLIVLPRQHRSLFSRWLQGNVTAKVQRRADVPVLTVREEEQEG